MKKSTMHLWYSSPTGMVEEDAKNLLDHLYGCVIIVPGMENWVLIELTRPIPVVKIPKGFVAPSDLIPFMNARRGDFEADDIVAEY